MTASGDGAELVVPRVLRLVTIGALLAVGVAVTPVMPGGAAGLENSLSGVSCAGPTMCFAVGGNTVTPLIMRWDGVRWSNVAAPSPNPRGSAALSGVSCPTVSSCVAVGSYANANGYHALIEQWNGTTWSMASHPEPAAHTHAMALTAVSCASSTSCMAVGYTSGATTSTPLIERWDGTGWSMPPAPKPHGADFVYPSGVSCPTTTTCFLVGSTLFPHLPGASLIERWNGNSWSVVPSLHPPGKTANQLNSVSCADANMCFAVGKAASGHTTTGPDTRLIERWNGKTWSIADSPTPTYPAFDSLIGVSCSSRTSCVAVGTFTHFRTKTFAEHWNGTKWAVVNSPNPGPQAALLAAVSCVSPTSSAAVGVHAIAPHSKVLTEKWNGTAWAIV